MKKNLFILVVLSFIESTAQNSEASVYNTTTRMHNVSINSSMLLENTSLNGELFTSGNIDNFKQEISDGLKDRNVLALQSRNGISYCKRAIDNKIGYSLSIYDRTEMDFSFTKDLFDLFFFCNKMFLGNIIYIENTTLSLTRFQQINLSFSRKFKIQRDDLYFPEEIELGLGYSYLIGNTHFSFNSNKSHIEMGEYGEYINMELDFTANVTDTNDISPFNVFGKNGSGNAFDFFLLAKKKKNNFFFLVKDYGSINWNKNATTYSTKKEVNFTGIEVEDILNINDSIINLQIDSLTDINLIKKGGGFKSYIPATIHISYIRSFNTGYIDYIQIGRVSKRRPFFEERGSSASNFTPRYYIGANFRLKGLVIKTSYSYGGYARGAVQFGLAQDMFKKHFQLVLGTNHFESIFSGIDGLRSADYYLSLSFLFGKEIKTQIPTIQ